MGFRDRFFTPKTAKAILSWRLLVGVAVGVVLGLFVHPVVGVIAGAAVYAGTVLAAMPRPAGPVRIDPFTLSEPWRQLVQQGQRANRRLRDTVAAVAPGPLRDRLANIAEELEHGLGQAYAIAQRGDQIDGAYQRLDPVRLRSRLALLEQQAGTEPSAEEQSAIDSVRRQLDSAERLKVKADDAAAQLRLTSTRLDELVARAAEVAVGSAEPDTYARDVDSLVEQLEALHLAVEEVNPQAPQIDFGGSGSPDT